MTEDEATRAAQLIKDRDLALSMVEELTNPESHPPGEYPTIDLACMPRKRNGSGLGWEPDALAFECGVVAYQAIYDHCVAELEKLGVEPESGGTDAASSETG